MKTTTAPSGHLKPGLQLLAIALIFAIPGVARGVTFAWEDSLSGQTFGGTITFPGLSPGQTISDLAPSSLTIDTVPAGVVFGDGFALGVNVIPLNVDPSYGLNDPRALGFDFVNGLPVAGSGLIVSQTQSGFFPPGADFIELSTPGGTQTLITASGTLHIGVAGSVTWTPQAVPDTGTTALMLGLGLLGMAGVKRKLRRA